MLVHLPVCGDVIYLCEILMPPLQPALILATQHMDAHHLQVHQSEDRYALSARCGLCCGDYQSSLLLVWGHSQHSIPHAEQLPQQQNSDEP